MGGLVGDFIVVREKVYIVYSRLKEVMGYSEEMLIIFSTLEKAKEHCERITPMLKENGGYEAWIEEYELDYGGKEKYRYTTDKQ